MVLGLTLLFLTFPLWFPWVLRPLAGSIGIRYGTFHRLSYSRFAVEEVIYREPTVTVTAKRVEAFVPTTWLWHRFRDRRDSRREYATVHDWKVVAVTHAPDQGSSVVKEPRRPGKTTGPPSTAKTVVSVQKILAKIRYWIPSAVISSGSVQIDQVFLAVSSAHWSHGQAEVGVTWGNILTNGVLSVNTAFGQPLVSGTDRLSASAIRLRSGTVDAEAAVIPQADGGFQFQSTNAWLGNPFELTARFVPDRMLPENAALKAPNFVLPREITRLDWYHPVKGSARVDWDGRRFDMDVAAGADPLEAQSNLPPVKLLVRASGDTNSATVRSAVVSAPWLHAELSRDLTVFFTGRTLRDSTGLKVSGDLSKQPWIPMQGTVQSDIDVAPGNGRWPVARFRLTGSKVAMDLKPSPKGPLTQPRPPLTLATESIRAEGSFVFPNIQLDSGLVVFAETSQAEVQGAFNAETQTFSEGRLKFVGPLVRQWLPHGWNCEGISMVSAFEGPLWHLIHSGQVTLTNLSSPQFLIPQGSADWSGEQFSLRRFAVGIRAGESAVEASGQATLEPASGMSLKEGQEVSVVLNLLNLSRSGKRQLELQSPAHISASRKAAGHGGESTSDNQPNIDLNIRSFHWAGDLGDIRLNGQSHWPHNGALQASIRSLSLPQFALFFKSPPPPVEISTFKISGGWTNGPVNFRLDFTGSGWTNSVSAQLRASADESGIRIEDLALASGTSRVASATGHLPVTLWPGSTNLIHLPMDQPLELRAAAQPTGLVWDKLGEVTGVQVQHPSLALNINGNWQTATGRVEFTAERTQMPKKGTNAPLSIGEIRLKAEVDREIARITELRASVQGQPIRIAAQLPMSASRWREVLAGRTPDLKGVTGVLNIDNGELGALADLYPGIISRQGLVNAKLALETDGNFSGTLRISNARTRPLANAGPIRDIEVGLRFHGRSVELTNTSARVGANSVVASGKADLSGTEWLNGSLPPFEVKLKGTNMPLSRQPESIVRADVSLLVKHTNGAPPVISGFAQLHDSYFLSDLRSLIPGGVTTPERRPPYFSINEPGLGDWRLAVDVKGTRFMRVRSPLFQGEISANLKLAGTLREPTAIGEMRIDSGIVRFPFANLDVQQGIVSLTPQDPYRPTLSVNAASKQFGYDIRMDVSGPASAPVLQFSSSPPLSSEQILLMVSAGELPGGAYSLTPQQRAQTIALFLGRDLLAKLGYGDQAQQRLTLRSGEQISEQGRPTYILEYQLTDRWAITGEYDRFGEFNAGVKWRIFSR